MFVSYRPVKMRVVVVFLVVLGICSGQETTTDAADITTVLTTTPNTEHTTNTIAPSTGATVVPDDTTTVATTTVVHDTTTVATTTVIPDDTTTFTPATTTVIPDDTTTVAPTTTTDVPDISTIITTTTFAPTTVAPVPYSDFYTVTENNLTCIMFSGDFRLSVNYTDNEEMNKTAEVRVPGPGANTTASGSCSLLNTTDQILSVHFGNDGSSNFNLKFSMPNKRHFELVDLFLSLPLDEATFPGAKDVGKTLSVRGSLPGLSNFPVMLNHSLECLSSIDSSNFTAAISSSSETFTATATALGFKFQAFSTVRDVVRLNDSIPCLNDNIFDLVPVAVGCALAALVVLVLVSYLIGRRIRSPTYESV